MKKLTPAQVTKTNAAKNQPTYLTIGELAEFIGRSTNWILGEIKSGNIVADGQLVTGKRGRPAWLFGQTKYNKVAKTNAKQVADRTAAKQVKADAKAARVAAKAAKVTKITAQKAAKTEPVAKAA